MLHRYHWQRSHAMCIRECIRKRERNGRTRVVESVVRAHRVCFVRCATRWVRVSRRVHRDGVPTACRATLALRTLPYIANMNMLFPFLSLGATKEKGFVSSAAPSPPPVYAPRP